MMIWFIRIVGINLKGFSRELDMDKSSRNTEYRVQTRKWLRVSCRTKSSRLAYRQADQQRGRGCSLALQSIARFSL